MSGAGFQWLAVGAQGICGPVLEHLWVGLGPGPFGG